MSISDALENFAVLLDNGDHPDGDAMEYLWELVGKVDKLERENKRITALQAEATFIMSEPQEPHYCQICGNTLEVSE